MGKRGKLSIGLMVPLVNLTSCACAYQHPMNHGEFHACLIQVFLIEFMVVIIIIYMYMAHPGLILAVIHTQPAVGVSSSIILSSMPQYYYRWLYGGHQQCIHLHLCTCVVTTASEWKIPQGAGPHQDK